MIDRAVPPARPWYELIVETIALKGWSKTTLSERSGISRSTIDNWQRNPRKPQASAVNAVADVLGIDRKRANELAGIIPRAVPEPVPELDDDPETLAALRSAYRDDPDKVREVAKALAWAESLPKAPASGAGESSPAQRAG